MRTRIEYRYLPNNTQEYANLQQFAKTFDHEIIPNSNINTYAHYSDGKLFGYSDHVFMPTIYPAFHPEYSQPKDVIQVMNDWRAHTQLSGKMTYIGVPMPDDSHRANFPQSVMEKLGLVRMKREVYSVR